MSPFNLLTYSEVGLHLLRSVFDLQRLLVTSKEVQLQDRARAATLLRKMAVCLDEIHKELKLEEPRPGKHAGSMEIYLRDFEERFTPFIGEDDSRSLKQDIAILFESNDSEDHLNLVTGFIALKKFQREGAIDKPHTDAAIAALFLAKEQLEATADIIEYC